MKVCYHQYSTDVWFYEWFLHDCLVYFSRVVLLRQSVWRVARLRKVKTRKLRRVLHQIKKRKKNLLLVRFISLYKCIVARNRYKLGVCFHVWIRYLWKTLLSFIILCDIIKTLQISTALDLMFLFIWLLIVI